MGYYDSYIDDALREAEEAARAVRNAYIISFVVFFLVLAAILTALVVTTMLALKKRAEHQKAVNSLIAGEMLKEAFTPTRKFFFCDRATFKKSDEYRQMLAVDSEHNRLALVDYESGRLKIVDYSQILNYEVYENGSVVADGIGVGGLGLGAFSMQASKIVKELRLIIRLKTVDDPHIAYQIVASKGIFNMGIGKNSQIYRMCFPTVQEVVSLLQVIINQNKETNKN